MLKLLQAAGIGLIFVSVQASGATGNYTGQALSCFPDKRSFSIGDKAAQDSVHFVLRLGSVVPLAQIRKDVKFDFNFDDEDHPSAGLNYEWYQATLDGKFTGPSANFDFEMYYP